ncbi:hypothetical protein JAAARDRAFT_36707 [Jaapia argillacea MUCL 33604]|uniref:Pentatricopeptide repeat-containing protein n=1 Tax=Jaapia argillacea MUCL 33604 TaxID=933084 RepID=A0A067PXF1_9AGAM|nr:hypothetical protein JAAARDRAFT_36707 [Jaapia argillacea MUCL 33604]
MQNILRTLRPGHLRTNHVLAFRHYPLTPNVPPLPLPPSTLPPRFLSFSFTPSYPTPKHPTPASRHVYSIVKAYAASTKSPLWCLVLSIFQTPCLYLHPNGVRDDNKALFEALKEYGVSEEEWFKWREVVQAKDLEEAKDVLERMGYDLMPNSTSSPNTTQDPPIPPWLFIYILSTKPLTPPQSLSASSLALTLPSSPLYLPLLSITAYHLSTHAQHPPLFSLLPNFLKALDTPPNIPHSTLHFNLLVRSLTYLPSSPTKDNLIHRMISKDVRGKLQVGLYARTVSDILADPQISKHLARAVKNQVERQRLELGIVHLEKFLQISARHGDLPGAGYWLDFIRKRAIEKGYELIPYGSVGMLGWRMGGRKESFGRYNTLYLSAFRREPAKAFAYLNRIAVLEQAKSKVKQDVGGGGGGYPRTRESLDPVYRKADIDIADWTTTLHLAFKHPEASLPALLKLLKALESTTPSPSSSPSPSTTSETEPPNAPPHPSLQPTLVTYTAVIDGLLKKGEWESALVMWRDVYARCRGCGGDRTGPAVFKLDKEALSVGVSVLTACGRPVEGFMLLERHAIKPSSSPPSPSPPRSPPSSSFPQIALDIKALNAYAASLNLIDRPDIVFSLWDNMSKLYALEPDVITLNILLKSGIRAAKLDQSLLGVMAQMRLGNPFQRIPVAGVSGGVRMDREGVVDALVDMLGADAEEGDGAGGERGRGGGRFGKMKVTGVWRGEPAWKVVRQIFRQVILGNHPELLGVESPAKALRTSRDSPGVSPVKDLANSLLVGHRSRSVLGGRDTGGIEEESVGGTTMIQPDTSPKALALQGLYPPHPYPSIIPTTLSFRRYILLLGLHSLSSEIPTTLAWMRALNVLPDKKTLALALAFWGEVSIRAPLLDRWRGREEYEGLVRWVGEWVGRGALPGEGDVGEALLVIKRNREGEF